MRRPKPIRASTQGVAVYGEAGDGDPAGLEGGFGDASGDMVGIFEGLPKGAVAPKPRRQNKKPEYPPKALADKVTGAVIVKCVVRADGYPRRGQHSRRATSPSAPSSRRN